MRIRWLAGLAMLLGVFVGTSASGQTTIGQTGGSTGGLGGSTGGLGGSTSGLGGSTSGLGGSTGLGGGGSTGLGGGGSSGLGGGSSGLGGGAGGGSGLGGGTNSDIGGGSFTSGGLIGQGSLTGATTNNSASIGGTSLLGKNYSYPLGKGLPTQNIIGGNQGGTANVAFGQPLFTVAAAAGAAGAGAAGGRLGAGSVGGTGGFQGAGGTATTTTGQGGFGSSAGIDRVVPYVTELGFEPTLTPPTVVRQQVQNMLANSTRLSNQGIQVIYTDDTHVIRGQASTERERLVAEAMARLTPGVRTIRNEVVVVPTR